MRNHLRTFVLIAALTALFMAVGYVVGGPTGMGLAFLFAAATNFIGYWNADRIVLAMYRARPVDETDPDPMIRNYVADVRDLAARAGLPRPRTFVIDQDQPNAFATGRDPAHAAVAANIGLLRLLDRREVRGVVGHELTHVKNRDTLTMTVTATIAGAVSALANFAFFFGGRDEEGRPVGLVPMLVVSLLAPIAAGLVQMAISRGREYEADKGGAEVSGDPEALASALEKIEAYARGGYVNPTAQANPATAHMFIINPLGGRGGDNLFSTHPDTANRVAALMQMAQGMGAPPAPPAPAFGSNHDVATAVPVTHAPARGPWG